MRPWIGITGRSIMCEAIDFIPRRLKGTRIDLHFRDYALRVAQSGAVPVQLTSSADAAEVMARLDGLLLSGGSDIEPGRYGQLPGPSLGPLDPERDHFEWTLLEHAVRQGKPVFGVCRGMQMINVFFGGSLLQDLGARAPIHDGPHADEEYRFHDVATLPGSRAEAMYGSGVEVPSAHHQAVSVLGEGLIASGHALDETVEILESETLPIFGVQWHAEWPAHVDEGFSWLVSASSSRMGV